MQALKLYKQRAKHSNTHIRHKEEKQYSPMTRPSGPILTSPQRLAILRRTVSKAVYGSSPDTATNLTTQSNLYLHPANFLHNCTKYPYSTTNEGSEQR
ncbi:uncharacterized protein LOC143228141 isoform X2 [Tachypleus tridentatus]|uniref:uncharacterized protein LOC143228141 isoform X2 n=1 Tax=Tachypleus tridentatus TaxID=6853 RepID=UPI003FCF9F59